jgi:tRNA nucleotidyltransferase (CCA-adding enzyme)
LAQRTTTVLQEHTLGSSALSPQTWPFDISFLPPGTHLVGGSVRDALLERHSDYLDLDFVMPHGAVETAETIARHYKAGFVLLDAERQIARVVFKQGTADFAQQVGDSLESDLRRRDFTMNAIAYNPHTLELFDPLQGFLDLEHCIVRMISAENLAEDPLRLLRAYRQAAQLGFTMDPATVAAAKQLAPHLQSIAAERIQSEFHYLLSSSKGTPQLRAAWEAGLLDSWFKYATVESMDRIEQLDRLFKALRLDWPLVYDLIRQHIRNQAASSKDNQQGISKIIEPSGSLRSWLTIAKLASLMPNDRMPNDRMSNDRMPNDRMPNDRIEDNSLIAETQLWNLKYSRSEIHAVLTLLKTLPQLQILLRDNPDDRRAQYHLFQQVGHVFPALFITGLAQGLDRTGLRSLMNRFLDSEDVVAHPIPVLSGQDLMSSLDLPPSPQVGRILSALQVAKAESLITDRDSAIAFAKTLLDRQTW